MDKRELQIIQELMEELQGQMDHSEDDFAERLGRKKPGIEVTKIEAGPESEEELMEDSELEDAEEAMGKDLDGDMEMGEDPEHAAAVMGAMEDSPEESLKRRLMKLRG